MIGFAAIAFIAGVLVVVSRQINGRLALSTSALHSSFWNHIVGFVFLTLIALAFGGLFLEGTANTPLWAYLGGPIGVIFIALSSWLVARIGAAQTAMLIIAGQMVSGVFLDLLLGQGGNLLARVIGVALILLGMWVNYAPRPSLPAATPPHNP
ncbi:transporter family-2 protein [Cognatiyoonia koreensis]|uniref:Transporter family-2 protein n=1 Tax=Cognatiyoonia koreensis TaxID=364200 RepID=A0A1I0MLA7_9RHOB|nr:DMT family transporter [Cognatiyoonia koreensis]SEV88681.1 transporter family-2 protein [Cognatiyoonia koreensis]